MLNKPVRIILDTNLWISFLIKNNFSKIDGLLKTKQVSLIFSDELLSEFIEVTQRKKFEKYFTRFDTLIVMSAIEKYATFVKVTTAVIICRDVRDNFLLSLAIDGQVDYLISGDNDLLELQMINSTKIIQITHFLQFYS